jgi:hypothetical protein
LTATTKSSAKSKKGVFRYFEWAVYYPHPGDEHPDHWATNAFVQYVLAKMNYQGQAFTYLVHCSCRPEPPLAEPDKPLKPPLGMTGEGGRWFDVPLTAEEIELKRRALNCYATQQKVMKPFLSAFIRSTELFCACSVPSVPVLPKCPLPCPFPTLRLSLPGPGRKAISAGFHSGYGICPALTL